MYCRLCDIEYPNTLRFCKWCGGALVDKEAGGKQNCPSCGKSIEREWAFCNECGVDLASLGAQPKDQICPGCSAEVRKGWMFCRQCGEQMATERANLRCSACGAGVRQGWLHCKQCAAPLGDSAEGGQGVQSEFRTVAGIPALPPEESDEPFGNLSSSELPPLEDVLSTGARRRSENRSAQAPNPPAAPSASSSGTSPLMPPKSTGQLDAQALQREYGSRSDDASDNQPRVNTQPPEATPSPVAERPGSASFGRQPRIPADDLFAPESGVVPPSEAPRPSPPDPVPQAPADDDSTQVMHAQGVDPSQFRDMSTVKGIPAIDIPVEEEEEYEPPVLTPPPGIYRHEEAENREGQPAGNGEGGVAPQGPATVALPPESARLGWDQAPPQDRAATPATLEQIPSPVSRPGPVAPPSAPLHPAPAARRGGGDAIKWVALIGTIFILLGIAAAGTIYILTRGPAEPEPVQTTAPEVPTTPETPEQPTGPPVAPTGMVYLEGATFQMGSDSEEVDPFSRPAHPVAVKPFFMDRNEVTNAEYKKFVDATGRAAPQHWVDGAPAPGDERKPVIYVTFADAAAYAEWAGKRLPTEAEWEFAARQPDGRRYPWGEEWDASRANVGNKGGAIQPVGTEQRGATPTGLNDMIGNVWEWTATDAELYPGSPVKDLGDQRGRKVIRGGNYASDATTGATYRGFFPPDVPGETLGFRCAKDLE